MEDSGIDSDSRKGHQDDAASTSSGSVCADCSVENKGNVYAPLNTNDPDFEETEKKHVHKKSNRLQLHKRLEKHLESAKRFRNVQFPPDLEKLIDDKPTEEQPHEQPLVQWDNESEDEFVPPPLTRAAARELTQQLIKEGYDLQYREEEEDDLDLVPPTVTTSTIIKNRICCCGNQCVIS